MIKTKYVIQLDLKYKVILHQECFHRIVMYNLLF